MSIRAMSWALRQKCGSPTLKLILLALADRCDDSSQCYPSFKKLSEDCELTRKATRTNIKRLADMGLVIIKHRRRDDGSFTSNIYSLPVSVNAVGVGNEIPHSGECDSLGVGNEIPPIEPVSKNLPNNHISPEAVEIASWFVEKSQEVKSKFADEIKRNYNEKSWSETIDKLHRLDNHGFETIRKVLAFALTDNFWSPNLRSLASLRKRGNNDCLKFDNIKASMEKTHSNTSNDGSTLPNPRDYDLPPYSQMTPEQKADWAMVVKVSQAEPLDRSGE